MKLKNLFESVNVIDILTDPHFLNYPISKYNIPTEYDWIIEYAISEFCNNRVGNQYLDWRKHPKNKHVLAFLYQWKEEASDPSYHKSVLSKYDGDLEALIETLTNEVTLNSDGSFDLDFAVDLSFYGVAPPDGENFFSVQPPKLNVVEDDAVGFILDYSALDEIPEWIPRVTSRISLAKMKNLKDLKNVHKKIKKCKTINLSFSGISSHVMGLLLIDGLEYIRFDDNAELERIINKHLNNGKDILDCQEELIDAGLEEYAQL